MRSCAACGTSPSAASCIAIAPFWRRDRRPSRGVSASSATDGNRSAGIQRERPQQRAIEPRRGGGRTGLARARAEGETQGRGHLLLQRREVRASRALARAPVRSLPRRRVERDERGGEDVRLGTARGALHPSSRRPSTAPAMAVPLGSTCTAARATATPKSMTRTGRSGAVADEHVVRP